jgi:hypothetical protein
MGCPGGSSPWVCRPHAMHAIATRHRHHRPPGSIASAAAAAGDGAAGSSALVALRQGGGGASGWAARADAKMGPQQRGAAGATRVWFSWGTARARVDCGGRLGWLPRSRRRMSTSVHPAAGLFSHRRTCRRTFLGRWRIPDSGRPQQQQQQQRRPSREPGAGPAAAASGDAGAAGSAVARGADWSGAQRWRRGLCRGLPTSSRRRGVRQLRPPSGCIVRRLWDMMARARGLPPSSGGCSAPWHERLECPLT